MIGDVMRMIRQGVRPSRPTLVTSVPKSGTHLVKGLLRQLGLRPPTGARQIQYYGWPAAAGGGQTPLDEVLARVRSLNAGQLLIGHAIHDAGLHRCAMDHGVRVVFVMRDPRAIVWSHVKHCERFPGSKFHHIYSRELHSDSEKVRYTLAGNRGRFEEIPDCWLPPFGAYLDRFVPWIDAEGVLVLRFEDLVGPRGGGDRARQASAVASLLEYIGLPRKWTDGLCRRLDTSTSSTYRSGQISEWRERVGAAEQRLMLEECGRQIERMGYEAR